MDRTLFDELERTLTTDGPPAALGRLCERLRQRQDYDNLFYARLPEVKGTAGTAALMMDEILRGKPGYEWTVNHVLPLADPLELTSVKLEVVGR